MKALVWSAVNRLEVRQVRRPHVGEGEVLVRVSHVGICGSDLHIRRGEHPRAKPPLIMGHELSGFVEEVGQNVAEWSVGDAVTAYPVIGCRKCRVCRAYGEHICPRLGLYGIDWDGGMAEFIKVQARKLHRLPPETDMARATLIEPLAVGVHTMTMCDFRRGTTAAVIGAGPIGLAIALCAKQAGARQVIISDISQFRLRVAESLGLRTVNARAENLSEVVRAATGGEGAEFVFEATGIPEAVVGMEQAVSIAGMLVIVGIFPRPIPVDLRDVAFRELKMVGIRMYAPAEFERAVELVSSGKVDVGPFITDIYPLDRGVEAFKRTAAGTDNIKVLIKAEKSPC